MRNKKLLILRWALYAFLLLLALLVQSAVLGHVRFFGVHLCLVPVAVACVSMREGPAAGAACGLCTGAVWGLSGELYGAVYLAALTVAGALCGYLCRERLTRGFVPCLLLSLMSLLLCEGTMCAFNYYLGAIPAAAFYRVLLPEIGLSLTACPVFYAVAWAVGRVGGTNGT